MECEKVIPSDILVDLCSRFVINVPIEEQSDLIRICFQVELAHWFYIDFYSKNFPQKRPCGLREFTLQVFKHIPFLQPFAKNIDEVIEEWKDYKFSVPTFGAILLDEDFSHVLLVQNYKSCWGFPKGKVNKDEPPYQCAIREVYEETGFDISHLIHPNDYIEATLNDRVIRLYVIPGVSKSEEFVPKTRNEIKAVDWFPVCDIPLSKKDAALKQLRIGYGTSSNAVYSAFYMVSPFIRKLRQWIYEHINNIPHSRRRERHKSCSDIDKMNSLNLNESVEMFKKFQSSINDESFKTDCTDETAERGKCTKTVINHNLGSKSPDKSIPSVLDTAQVLKNLYLKSPSSKPSDQIFKNIYRESGFSMLKNIKISSELNSILSAETVTSKSPLDQYPQSVVCYSSSSQNITSDSTQPLLSITSSDSAFRKVEKSSKLNRRKRGKNKGLAIKDSAEYNDGTVGFSENTPVVRKQITCIPSLLNFQFDISSIIEGMNEAVGKNFKKQ